MAFLISDLASEVIAKVQNRNDKLARSYTWLRDAILEISGNTDLRDDFDELEEYGTAFVLTPGTQEYAFSNIVPSGDFNLATLDVLIWTDPPTNSNRQRLTMTSYQAADDTSTQSRGLPSEWYRFADTIGFVLTPDKAYQVQPRILRRHPINDAALQNTTILLPREYNEVLVWAAAERGFAELLQFEKAAGIHQLLHGDPKKPDQPGLIKSIKSRRKKENWRRQKPLQVVVDRYGH